MREMVRIAFREEDVPGGKEAILSLFQFEPGAVKIYSYEAIPSVSIHIHLEKDDARLPRLRAEFQRREVEDWTEILYDKFTEEELDAAPRLIVVLHINLFTVLGGAGYGTQYDLAQGCPACGSGSPQTSPLFIWDDDVRHLVDHRVAKTNTGDIIVSENVAEVLDGLGISGLKLRSVYTIDPKTKRQIKLRWRQLSAERTAPPRLPQSTGLFLWDEKQCQVCKRESFGPDSPLRLCYRASDIAKLDEVSETWEVYCETHLALGPDQDPLIGRPWLLVTPRVMRAMQALGFPSDECKFIPIRVVDE